MTPETLFYLTDHCIIKVAEIANGIISGFDILTESLVVVPFHKATKCPDSIFELLSERNKKAQIIFVESYYTGVKTSDAIKSRHLAISDRTYTRLKNQHWTCLEDNPNVTAGKKKKLKKKEKSESK